MTAQTRLTSLDIARTLAVVCMVIFHFTFDLALFGHIDPGTMSQPFWYYFARLIAGSFLFLSGIGLWLAHGRGIRWPAFWKRWLMIAAAAALITTASIWLVPGGPIWFGILHAMAATALLGLIALRLPWPLTLALALLIFAAAWGPRLEAFDPLWLVWTGLAQSRPMMGDYTPLIPWAAPALVGLATAKAIHIDQWRGTAPSPLIRTLTFPGRHSLIIYLIHQPVLFGLFNAYGWVTS
jgi:uncharacterized membrane protein